MAGGGFNNTVIDLDGGGIMADKDMFDKLITKAAYHVKRAEVLCAQPYDGKLSTTRGILIEHHIELPKHHVAKAKGGVSCTQY